MLTTINALNVKILKHPGIIKMILFNYQSLFNNAMLVLCYIFVTLCQAYGKLFFLFFLHIFWWMIIISIIDDFKHLSTYKYAFFLWWDYCIKQHTHITYCFNFLHNFSTLWISDSNDIKLNYKFIETML